MSDRPPAAAAPPLRPRVSVLIPTFNRGQCLRRVLDSVFAQTWPPYEVIVVDDGSTDDSRSLVAEWGHAHPELSERLQYVVQQNQGKSVALNRALALASGDWIAYDDSDDLWSVQKLEWQFRALAAYPECSVCFTDARFVPGPGTAFERARTKYPNAIGRIDDPLALVTSGDHGIFMQTVVVSRSTMNRVGEFDPRLRVGQDTDFILRLALEGPFCYVNLPLTDIDRSAARPSGLTTQFSRRSQKRLQAGELMFTKWLTMLPPARRDLRVNVERLLSMFQAELAMYFLLAGSKAEAIDAMRRSLRTRPSARGSAKLLLLLTVPRLMAAALRRRRSRDDTGRTLPAPSASGEA